MHYDFIESERLEKAMKYDEYLASWKRQIENTNHNNLNEIDKNRYGFSKLNLHRTLRIHKTYSVGDDLRLCLDSIDSPQTWMVLTEHWCGDSTQNLPFIAEMAKQNSLIDLRILERDKNLDMMDNYLTNGKSRRIPKRVAFDEDGNELFQWGPRPQIAQSLYSDLMEKDIQKDERNKQLHLWYSRNKGEAIEKEFGELLNILELKA